MAAPTSTPSMRYVRGPTNTAAYIAPSGVQINPGDLLVYYSGVIGPAQTFPMVSGSEVQNWSGFRSQFLGVALGQWNSTSVISGAIVALLEGLFAYPGPVASGVTYAVGTFVGPTMNQSSGYYQPQQLMQCSGQATAIGTVAETVTPTASGRGTLLVNLQSYVVKGGIGL